MSTLLATCILFALSGMAAAITHKRFEEHLPWAVCAVIGVLYGFSLFDGLQAGFCVVLLLAGLCAAALPVWMIVKRTERPWKRIATPGCMVFFLIAAWLLFSYRGYMYTEWDDFSHWGLAVKNMFVFSQLPSGVSESTITYVDYPPATTLFSWFWVRLSGVFNEEDTQRALNMLMLCHLLPMMKKQEWKKPGRMFAMATVLFILPLAVYPDVYRTLQVECLLGCQALYILCTWFEEKHDMPALMNIGAVLFLMPLVKETGMLMAVMLIVIMAVDSLRCGKRDGRKLVQLALIWVLPVLLGRFSWSVYLRLNQVTQVWDKSAFSLQAVIALLMGNGPSYQPMVIQKYINALCRADWWHSGHLISLSHVMWILLMAGLQLWCVEHTGDLLKRKRYHRGFLLLRIMTVAYLVVLLMMYLFLFRADEAKNLISLGRYLSMVMLPLIGWTVLTTVSACEHSPKRSFSHMAFAMLLGLLLVVDPLMIVQNTVAASEENTAAYEFRMDELIPDAVLSEVNSETDRVYIVSCNDEGYQYYLDAYQFTPVPVQDGMWTIWPVCEKGAEWYEQWAVEYSPEEWAHILLDGGFTHVYLDTADERFVQDYASLFETPASVRNGGLYRVQADAESVKLISLQ